MHVRKYFTFILFVLVLISFKSPLFGGLYGEHKTIGDAAFSRVFHSLDENERQFIWNALSRNSTINSQLGWVEIMDGNDTTWITYGDICGLSGDHANSPLEVFEALRQNHARLKRIALLQHRFLKEYHNAAPDAEIAKQDFSYVTLAMEDKSHFYVYGDDIREQIEQFDNEVLETLTKLRNPDIFGEELYDMNAINKYVTLHAYALILADSAAHYYTVALDTSRARGLLRLAFVVNAFADHYLQDAFSSGHRVVFRTLFGSLTTDKVLHDFFGKRGLLSINLNNNKWVGYGDGYYDKKEWKNYERVSQRSKNMSIAIQANDSSLSEVVNRFKDAIDPGYKSDQTYLQQIQAMVPKADRNIFKNVLYNIGFIEDETVPYDYFLTNYKALQLIPIPFKTDSTVIEPYYQEFNPSVKRSWSNYESFYFRDYVKQHKGNGLSLIIGRITNPIKQRLLQKGYFFGYSIYVKGILHDFEYDNFTMEQKGWTDWWLDLAISNTYGEYENIRWSEFALGVRYVRTYFKRCIEIAAQLDMGLRKEKVLYGRFTPSVELGILPESGTFVRITMHKALRKNRFWGVSVVQDITDIPDQLIGYIFD